MTFLFYIIAIFSIGACVWFYLQYRLDMAQLARIAQRGDLKYLKRYSSTLNLPLLRKTFANLPDTSDIKKGESHSLSLTPEFLNQIFARFPYPLMIVNDEENMHYINPAAHKILHLSSDAIRQPLSYFLRSPALLNGVSEVLEGTIDSTKVEYIKTGSVDQHFDIHIMKFVTLVSKDKNEAEETHPLALLIFIDTTFFYRLENMRSEFIANAGHELRTPLSSLMGFIETLKTTAKDDEAAREQFLKIMEQQASRMANLLDDLLSLSKIELEENQFPDKKCDLVPIIKRVIDHASLEAKKQDMDIIFNPGKIKASVLGTEDQLFQVFQNLLLNSIKYAHKHSMITLTLTEAEPLIEKNKTIKRIQFSIQDESDGIPEKHLMHLTERFYRVDKARSKELGGTGLGLAIVKHIVNRHRGELIIQSEVKKGSCFTILLPTAE